MTDTGYVIGTSMFSAAVRFEGGRCLIDLTAFIGQNLVRLLGGRRIDIDPLAALSSLADHWVAISGRYGGGSGQSFEAAVGSIFGRDDLRSAILRREGLVFTVEASGQAQTLGSNSVLVAECLLSLGNTIAAAFPGSEEANRWAQVSAVAEIHPTPASKLPDMEPAKAEVEVETRWYAAKLGQSFEEYVRAARWLQLRQYAYAAGYEGHTEPTSAEYEVTTIPQAIAADSDLDALADRVSRTYGSSPADLLDVAIAGRNTSARAVVVFERWYGSDRRTVAPDSITSTPAP
jgi:hypothetical protein